MPRDVNLGEGYVEGVMVSPTAPGQHRGQYEMHDGSTVLIRPQQMADLGRRPRGRGGRGWGRGWGGPVFYEPLYIEQITDRKPFILDESDDEDKKKDLKGLADSANDCISRIVSVAATAAREAIEGARQGVFSSMEDVADHIRRRVCQEFQSHARAYILAMQEAVKTAIASARPEVEKALAQKKGVSGLACCGKRGMAGLSGAISSQADYNLLSKVQVRANAIMAEISGIGKDEWDAIKNEEFESEGWSPADNYSYDNMMAFWLNNIKSIILTPSKKPTVEQINEVNRLAGGTENLIALVKSHATPAAVQKGEADRAQTTAMLSEGGYKSPSAVGWDTFQKEVEKKASSLVTSGIGVTTIAAIAAGLLGAIYFLGGRR